VNSQVTRTMHQSVRPCAKSSGCPESRISKAVPAMDIRVAPNFASFNATGAGTSGRPSASHFQLRLPMWLRVAPHPGIFRLCRRWIFRLPRISHPSTLPAVKLQVAPRLRSTRRASR